MKEKIKKANKRKKRNIIHKLLLDKKEKNDIMCINCGSYYHGEYCKLRGTLSPNKKKEIKEKESNENWYR